MIRGASLQDRILQLEGRIANQRKATKQMDAEIKRMREFIRAIGYDPDDFRYDDRNPPSAINSVDACREADRRTESLRRGVSYLEQGLPVTALENMKDDLRSMGRLFSKP